MTRRQYLCGALALGVLGGGAGWWVMWAARPLAGNAPGAPARFGADKRPDPVESPGGLAGRPKVETGRPLRPDATVGAGVGGTQPMVPALRIITDPEVTLPRRLAAVEGLFQTPLTPATLAEVLTYLAAPVGDELPVAERERALRNQLLNALRQQPACAPLAVPVLVRQAADPDQDAGLRDYALQHLAAWVPTLPAAEKQAALSALAAALRNPAETYAGTALIGLHDLASRQTPGLEPGLKIGEEVRRIALDEGYSPLSRLTALALAAELRLADPALETLARQWVEAPYLPLGARRTAEAFLRQLASNSL